MPGSLGPACTHIRREAQRHRDFLAGFKLQIVAQQLNFAARKSLADADEPLLYVLHWQRDAKRQIHHARIGLAGGTTEDEIEVLPVVVDARRSQFGTKVAADRF